MLEKHIALDKITMESDTRNRRVQHINFFILDYARSDNFFSIILVVLHNKFCILRSSDLLSSYD